MIQVQHVTKTFGKGPAAVHALDGVDVRIGRGAFVSIMGPSGSGKSTLLNLLSALDVPTSGHIMIDGQDTATLTDDELTVFRRRHIGLVFQAFNLLSTLDALENVLLPVMLERRATRHDIARAERLLHDVGLDRSARHRVTELSGGERQRVAIARAFILEPKLILADEPTGNLDSVTGHAVLGLLREACERHATTIVMVTHDEAVARVAHRILRLKDGRFAEASARSAAHAT